MNDEINRQSQLPEDLIQLENSKPVQDKGALAAKLFKPGLDLAVLAADEAIWLSVSDSTQIHPPVVDNKMDVYSQLEDYIGMKKRNVSEATIDIYRTVGGNQTIRVTKAKCDWITSHIGRH